MPLFAANKIVIKLDTKGKIGTSIINCRFPTDCPGLLPSDIEYKHPEDDFMDWSVGDFDYETKQTETGKEFIIDPHSKGCYPILIEDPLYMEDALPVCAYQITLSSSESFPQEYTLAADSEGHQWLFPGIPKSSAVFEKEKEHFVVNVPPHRDVKSVNFQLTEFSGDVVIYISRTEMYPNEKTDDTKFAHEGMIMFTNSSSLDGTYYITVEGLTTSSFGLTCNIIGFNDEQEDYALTLEAGVPQRGVLLPNQEHPAQFYKFKLNVDEKWVGTIKIAVSTLRGNVLVGVNNNGNMPLPNVHTWKSYGRDLEIASDDPNFKRKGTYHIGVFVDWTKLKLGDIVFTISYSIKEKNNEGEKPYLQQHQFVSPLTPFYGTIRKGEVEFFEAFVLPKDKKITVYKQADVGDVDIFLTTDPDNLYPTVSSYTYTTKNTFRDYIELTESDFTKICKGVEDTICSFFFSVLPKGDQAETPYSISMSREYKQAEKEGEDRITWVPLEDGRQIKTDVPVSGSSNFYFYTTPYNPGVVTVSCPGKIISIYAAKTKVEIGISAKPEIKAVTSENYEYSSFDSGTASVGISSLTIPAYENEDTNIVSVAVYFFDVDSTAADNSRFTILASTEMTYIYTGRPYYGTVQENKYMYFFFDVYKDSTTLLISLTTLDDGDPDLVVSTGYDSRPTLESHQFASVSLQRTELLEINDLDIYPLNSMANTWVVGVYGRKASTFTLTVLYEDQKTVELTQGQPFEMYTREESKMFFKYYQSRSSDLEIKIDQLSGSMEAYISTMKGDGDLVSNLPNETNYSWKISPSYNPVINIPSTDPKTCYNCVFLITLKSSEASKLSIIITEGNKFAQVQNGMTYSGALAGESIKKYSFSSSNIDQILLSLSVIGSRLDAYISHNPTVNETNYVWTTELSPANPSTVLAMKKSEYEEFLRKQDPSKRKGVWNGQKEIPSENNTFYIVFKNPFYSSVNYSFTVGAKDSSTVMKHGYKHPLTISPNGGVGSLLYYSADEEEILKIIIEFTVERTVSTGPDSEFDRYLKKGLPLNVYYWSDKSTAGLGSQVSLLKDYVMMDSVSELPSDHGKRRYKIREAFTTISRRGKFQFEIENPFSVAADVQVTAYSTEYGSLSLGQNSQFSNSLSKGMSETFEVYLTSKGQWYFFVQACAGNVDFSLGDNPANLATGSSNTIEITQETNAIKQIEIKEAGMRYVRIGRSESSRADNAQFTLSSSFFADDPKQYNYELRSSAPNFQTKYIFGPHNSILTVDIPAINVMDAAENDEIIYRVKACPERADEPDAATNVCRMYEECKTAEIQRKLSSNEGFRASVERLLPGKYYVQVTAEIQHKGKMVKFVPYPVQYLTIEKSITNKLSEALGTILLALGILAISGIICYKCYGKFKKVTEDRGFELPSFGGKRKEYGFLGDDL